MIRKVPKSPPLGKKILGGFIIFEVAVFGVSYYFWKRLNQSREFRFDAQKKFPWILEKYYSLGEWIDNSNVIRKIDKKHFAIMQQETDSKSN